MKIQPALPTKSTGKVKTDLQTHLRVSAVCLQDTHPQKNPLLCHRKYLNYPRLPFQWELMVFLNITRAKPYFLLFYSLFSSLVVTAPDLLREYQEYFTEIQKDSLFLPLPKGRPGGSEVGGASAVSAHRGTSPWTDSSTKQAAAFRRTREKGKATALKPGRSFLPKRCDILHFSCCI